MAAPDLVLLRLSAPAPEQMFFSEGTIGRVTWMQMSPWSDRTTSSDGLPGRRLVKLFSRE